MGKALGAPGYRPRYGSNSFAAFVGDPEGYAIGAVCHAAERARSCRCAGRQSEAPRHRPRLPRERCGVGLRLAYWVAQVRNADARDHRRVAKDGWHTGEMIKESNSGAKKNRRDVDVDFVEEASIQALLDGVSAVDPNGLPGSGGLGLVHGAFDAVGHEVDSRVGSRPSVGDVVGKDECRSPGVISAPAVGDFEGASTGEHGAKSGCETANVLGTRL